jgi:hypothetical protein
MPGEDQEVFAPPEPVGHEPRKDYNAVLEYYITGAEDELDLVGMVAYALYKRQKRDWIVQYRAEHHSNRPSPLEIAAVTSNYMTPDLRETLRNRASDLLGVYANSYVESLEPEIRLDAVNTETLRQAREIEASIKAQSGFWQQVGTGLIATGIWTLLVTGIIVAAAIFGSDFIDAWRAFFPATHIPQ